MSSIIYRYAEMYESFIWSEGRLFVGQHPPARRYPFDIYELTEAIFLPEASDFIARNSAETVKITKELGSIDRNAFIKGLQEQAIESSVSVTAGVHLPTNSESHVLQPFLNISDIVCKYCLVDKSSWKD
jgi:hypothetical protein